MLQLASDSVQLMTTRMGVQSTVIYGPEEIRDRYGLEPRQMIDFKSMKGDSTDNIPGIAGVGDKTAAGWLQQFGTLEGIYEHLDELKPPRLAEKLRELKDDVFLWRELVTIDRNVPIELDLTEARLGDYDRQEVLRLFREYEFRTLVERLPAVDGEEALAPGEGLRAADRSAPVPAALIPGREPSARNRPPSLVGEGTRAAAEPGLRRGVRVRACRSHGRGRAHRRRRGTGRGGGPERRRPSRRWRAAGSAGRQPGPCFCRSARTAGGRAHRSVAVRAVRDGR